MIIKNDHEQMLHFKALYEASVNVIEDLLKEVNVYGPPIHGNRAEAKQLIKKEMKLLEQRKNV